MRDFKRMQNDPPEGVNGAPQDNDIMKWHAVIFGCWPTLAHLIATLGPSEPHTLPPVSSTRQASLAARSCPAAAHRPDDTAWEDGTFKLSVEFTEEYPNKAPTVSAPRGRSKCT